MTESIADITPSLRVAGMLPLDAKSIFQTIEQIKDLGEQNSKAFTYYEGMPTYCVENATMYRWQEMVFGSVGLIVPNFVYPPNTFVNGVNYSARIFNFVVDGSSSSETSALFFNEPSVNIEIKNSAANIQQAIHLGNMDIGAGNQNVCLLKNSFVSQSGYDIKSNRKIGDQIKMFNATTNSYLGHFLVTSQTYQGYRILTVIEKGNWDVEAVYNTQSILIHVLEESLYDISVVNGMLSLLKGSSVLKTINLSELLSSGDSPIVSGILNPTNGVVTFTKLDGSNFGVDFSGVINAADFIDKNGITAVKNNDIYQNLFVLKAPYLHTGEGFYSADLQTNYNNTTFQGFPYPAGRDFVVCLYNGARYLLVRKNNFAFRRLFLDPNAILGMSFYKFRNNTAKSMEFLAYLKILARKTDLANLNANYHAFPIFPTLDSQIPFSVATGSFDETQLRQLNEPSGRCMISLVTNESIPLRKNVTAPYTLKDSDHGRVLYVSGSGNITVPALNFGFECGFVQGSTSTNEIGFVAASGVTLLKPSNKRSVLEGQYYNCYLFANEEYIPGGVLKSETNSFLLLGDLKTL